MPDKKVQTLGPLFFIWTENTKFNRIFLVYFALGTRSKKSKDKKLYSP